MQADGTLVLTHSHNHNVDPDAVDRTLALESIRITAKRMRHPAFEVVNAIACM